MLGSRINEVVLPQANDGSLDALKARLNLTSNSFVVNVENTQTIKTMMRYAAENNQEITIVIPLRKTVRYRS